MAEVEVFAEHNYTVWIGAGALNHVSEVVDGRGYERALVIYPKAVEELAHRVGDLLEGADLQVGYFSHPDAEAGKTVNILNDAWNAAGSHHVGRRDLIVGVGGGATTDLAGFVAATWLRGVDVLQVPTTLLGMVDAAVGGKTGINTDFGKNLAGAFHSPVAVIADLDALHTLPADDFTNGMGEVIKCGVIRDPSILTIVEEHGPIDASSPFVEELVEKAVRVKSDVVSQDLKEDGLRETLNYGHTLAHAVEKLADYQIPHGAAVAIGMVFAAHVAEQLGYADATWRSEQTALVQRQGLPTTWQVADFQLALEVMRSDKKVRSSNVRMVLSTRPGQTRVEAIETQILTKAAQAMNIVADVQDHS